MNPILKPLQLINREGYPIARAMISIFANTDEKVRTVATDENGCAIMKLAKTDQYIVISKAGYQSLELHTAKLDDEVIELPSDEG